MEIRSEMILALATRWQNSIISSSLRFVISAKSLSNWLILIDLCFIKLNVSS